MPGASFARERHGLRPTRDAGRVVSAPARTPVAAQEPWLAAPVAATLSLVTAWVHLAYWESHWDEWWGYGAFFLAIAIAQALFAPAILHWGAGRLALAGIAGNLAIVATYVASRTSGVPVGTHAGVAERAGVVDLATTAAEIAIVAVLLTMVDRRTRRGVLNLMLLTGSALWVLRLTDHLP